MAVELENVLKEILNVQKEALERDLKIEESLGRNNQFNTSFSERLGKMEDVLEKMIEIQKILEYQEELLKKITVEINANRKIINELDKRIVEIERNDKMSASYGERIQNLENRKATEVYEHLKRLIWVFIPILASLCVSSIVNLVSRLRGV